MTEATATAGPAAPTTKKVTKRTKKVVKGKGAKAGKKEKKKGGKKKKAAAREPGGPSKTQLAALGALNKSNKPLTRTQISKKLGGTFIGGKVMGHRDPAKLTETSLVGRKMVKFAPSPDGAEDRAVYYAITAAGRKALDK